MEHQIKAPKKVNILKVKKFILNKPAGKDIYCLIPGKSRPINIE